MNANTILNNWINLAANSLQNRMAVLSNSSVYGTVNNKMRQMDTYKEDLTKYIVCQEYVCDNDQQTSQQICDI